MPNLLTVQRTAWETGPLHRVSSLKFANVEFSGIFQEKYTNSGAYKTVPLNSSFHLEDLLGGVQRIYLLWDLQKQTLMKGKGLLIDDLKYLPFVVNVYI